MKITVSADAVRILPVLLEALEGSIVQVTRTNGEQFRAVVSFYVEGEDGEHRFRAFVGDEQYATGEHLDLDMMADVDDVSIIWPGWQER